MSNQASQVSRVAVMNAVTTTLPKPRQANHAVVASAASRMMSKPTQVSFQCPAMDLGRLGLGEFPFGHIAHGRQSPAWT